MPDISRENKIDSLTNDPLHFQAFNMVIDKVKERLKANK